MQIDTSELTKRLMIADASFLTLSEKTFLQKNIDNFNDLALMSINELSLAVRRDLGKSFWDGKQALRKAQIASALIKRIGIQWVFADEAAYPAMLREMKDSPYVIFYRGSLDCLEMNCVSMVGTRKATYSGRRAAFEFAESASNDGTTVVSGLAYGIDISSHKGALSGKAGKTVAVLPSGIDTIVPSQHIKTAMRIIEQGGLILSEYTPGTPAVAFRFVQRNRIIAALSPATVVVQSPSGGGAMITASFALDYNRYVFFHEACFDDESKSLEQITRHNLEAMAAKGGKWQIKARNKMLSSPERYIEDGAPVIKSYKEYRELMEHTFCGENITQNNGQRYLF